MPVVSPVSERLTVVVPPAADVRHRASSTPISVLVLGHVFVANMTGNVIFLGLLVRHRTPAST